jgi:hypothetical protein
MIIYQHYINHLPLLELLFKPSLETENTVAGYHSKKAGTMANVLQTHGEETGKNALSNKQVSPAPDRFY